MRLEKNIALRKVPLNLRLSMREKPMFIYKKRSKNIIKWQKIQIALVLNTKKSLIIPFIDWTLY